MKLESENSVGKRETSFGQRNVVIIICLSQVTTLFSSVFHHQKQKDNIDNVMKSCQVWHETLVLWLETIRNKRRHMQSRHLVPQDRDE